MQPGDTIRIIIWQESDGIKSIRDIFELTLATNQNKGLPLIFQRAFLHMVEETEAGNKVEIEFTRKGLCEDCQDYRDQDRKKTFCSLCTQRGDELEIKWPY